MSDPLTLGKYSFGMGDRFAHQAKAQLQSCILLANHGVDVISVWNKSNREHDLIGSHPSSVRTAAQKAVTELGWKGAWHVDADHVGLHNVDRFLDSSDFFTIDVADFIGRPAPATAVQAFIDRHPELTGKLQIPQIDRPFEISRSEMEGRVNKYLAAVEAAGKIYRRIAQAKGAGHFITEVSLDETDRPQTPVDLLIILAALADEQVPVQTIAPKFTGRFNKGVDYVGDVAQFENEFGADLATIAFAVRAYQLPQNLKLSVHSGSDKFSLYPVIQRALRKFDAGLHLKTAGTTWLEEMIGLIESGGEALALAREIYSDALAHFADLCAPYAAVVDIDPGKLPAREQVNNWPSEHYAAALRHQPGGQDFNPNLRQFLHLSYKIAAQKGDRYLRMLEACEEKIGRNVTANLYERHLRPLFLGV